jgi:2-oxoglutarate ferredoxin oxidoreductase subunit beta
MSSDVRFTEFKSDKQPTWCPGSGDFGTMNGMMKALANTGNDPDSTFVVAGIGCARGRSAPTCTATRSTVLRQF